MVKWIYWRPVHSLLLCVLSLQALGASGAPIPIASVSASTPLGTVQTATLVLENFGEPATTVQLYEAWDAAAAIALNAAATSPLRVPLPAHSDPISADLIAALEAEPDGRADMLIFLADQADLSAAAAITDWNERGAAVVARLQSHAARTQGPLLRALRQAGYVPRPYWIVNAIGVTGDRALAEWAARQAGVAVVGPNAVHALELEPAADYAASESVAWGVSKIRAPSVWEDWGVRGEGIVVANIDTGVQYSHTTLINRYRGWSPTGMDHDYNWFDAAVEPRSLAPTDAQGHGTHTMGTMVGAAADTLPAIGVAPGARWIGVRGCSGSFCSDEALIASAEWVLAPTDQAGANPRPDLRPHIINNSWGKAGEHDWYTGYVTAWNAAGIFSVFAAGNSGAFEGCGSSAAPGNYASAFAVGATAADDFIADFSSRGPTADSRIKPDLSAPGVAVPSAWIDGSIKTVSGTSMAAPHVAGTVALLWSANPALIGDLETTRWILTQSAVPRTSTECGEDASAVPNNVYGWGRLDARQAVQTARVDVPWLAVPQSVTLPANDAITVEVELDARQVPGPGTYAARVLVLRNNGLSAIPVTFTVEPAADTALVSGRLTDRWTGAGVYGRVRVEAGPSLWTDSQGYYTATLPYGTYNLTASASGYWGASRELSVPATGSANFTLTADLPHLTVNTQALSATVAFGQHEAIAIALSNEGTQPLSVTASVPPTEFVGTFGAILSGGLYDLSATPPLSLTDDIIYPEPLDLGFTLSIYGQMVRQLYLSSNGWVSYSQPSSAAAWAECLPHTGVPAGTLAPFWADLDPSQGGAVRAGQVTPDTFVVSFEAVPPWRKTPDPSGPTYTFQLALHADGRIEFLYGDMGDLSGRWSIGTYFDQQRAQRLACYKSPMGLAGQRWELLAQPLPGLWLEPQPTSLLVPPGESAVLNAVVHGFGYSNGRDEPLQGTLRLTTNDPGRALVEVPVLARLEPAPVTFYFPIIGQ